MKYRAEIDGLRALAVIPVILYHADFDIFQGGFVGVDIFFVISGYLITSIIIRDIENNHFSLINFYERRARRILPSLFFIVFLTVIFSCLYLPPHALKDVGQSVFSVSLFISNIFFYFETDYFANTAKMAPLLHTWSLGVEEQFYILFPILLLFIKKLKKLFQIFLIFFLLICSLYISESLLKNDQEYSFFIVISRFWELAIGSLLAMIKGVSIENKFKLFWNDLFALLGIFLILFQFIFIMILLNFQELMH